ncbi:uncharacterized protein LOC119586586 [Penaeus monodon]|uniref:uncharacterized protein LOC119586586 n=1 Tax=Penaeus monodon TaxID=6687 RepID=UPI0018A76FAB|nr:uncharacterized protein LOC119586586 [Penaeus monodon]
MRLGTLNVGAMAGRGRAVGDLMKNRKVDILRVQETGETGWSGNEAKEWDDGYKARMVREIDSEITDIEEWWNRANEIILKVGKEVLGKSSGKIWENKETWRLNEEIQQKTKRKKEAKKRWEETQLEADRIAY